jgi:hypothetical protein
MSRLRALLMILIVGGGIYVGSKVAAAYYAFYQFHSDLEQVALVASYSTKSEAEIQESVIARGRDYDIPLRPEQIQVRRAGNELAISAEYTVHLDIPIYPFDLRFTPATKTTRGALKTGFGN